MRKPNLHRGLALLPEMKGLRRSRSSSEDADLKAKVVEVGGDDHDDPVRWFVVVGNPFRYGTH